MSMVERVAKALHKADNPDGSYEGFFAHTPDPQIYERMARAAIEAMREPTEAMDEEGAIFSDCNAATRTWQAMIDAALKGASGSKSNP